MKHRNGFSSCVIALMALGMGACGGDYSEESIGSEQESIVSGDALDRVARPYEEATITVHFREDLTGGCSGTLLGNQGFARHALTARHCLDGITPSRVRIGRDSQVIARGSAIFFHPAALEPMPNTVDVALIELDRDVPLSTKQYFTTLSPTELIGETARCYGGGSQDGTTVATALFTIKATDSSGSTALHYNIVNPNAAGQRVGNGDSGGPCVRTTGTTSMTIFGIDKTAGLTGARYTAAVSFSDWVRTFVPR